MKPVYYTEWEGGIWIRWDISFGDVSEEDLKKRSKYTVTLGRGMQVHSLLFSNRDRWDCINGFTGKINYEPHK